MKRNLPEWREALPTISAVEIYKKLGFVAKQ